MMDLDWMNESMKFRNVFIDRFNQILLQENNFIIMMSGTDCRFAFSNVSLHFLHQHWLCLSTMTLILRMVKWFSFFPFDCILHKIICDFNSLCAYSAINVSNTSYTHVKSYVLNLKGSCRFFLLIIIPHECRIE